MAQKILVRRGTEAERQAIAVAPSDGELLYTSDNHEIFVGDGVSLVGNSLGYLSLREGGTINANTSVVGAFNVTGDVGITGNLTVTGAVTQTISNEVVIGDSIIILNNNSADVPVNNAGIEIERGLSTNVSILWNEGSDQWEITDGGAARRLLDSNDILVAGAGISISSGTVSNTDRGSSQAIFKNIGSDAGTVAASINNDTLNIVGAGGVSTAISGNTLTITAAAISDASTTVKGIVELATTAETDAGTDAIRAVTPASLVNVLADIAANTAKVSNVTTNLSYTTAASSGTVVSSDGTDATIPGATTIAAGLLTSGDKQKLDGIAPNATANAGTVTSVTAGNGIAQSGTATVNPTLFINADDTSIVVSADGISVGVIDGGTF